MTDRTVTSEELDRYERAIRQLVDGLGIAALAAAQLAAVNLNRPGWLLIFEKPTGALLSQYISDPYDAWAARFCQRHLYAVDLLDPEVSPK